MLATACQKRYEYKEDDEEIIRFDENENVKTQTEYQGTHKWARGR